MRRSLQAGLLVTCGLGLLHVSLLTDLCLRYVKEGMRPPLVVSGAVLVLLGLASAVLDRGREDRDGDGPGQRHGHEHTHGHGHESRQRSGQAQGGQAQAGHEQGGQEEGRQEEGRQQQRGREHGEHGHGRSHGHDHSAVPRVAWLLLLPALSLLCYAPPALGAYTAARQPPEPVTHTGDFDPLPPTSPLPITLSDFTSRVQEDRGRAIRGRLVRMTGFVTPGSGAEGGSGGWELTRIILNCCAADAQSVKVRIHGGPALAANTWVTVTGTWHPGGTLGTRSAVVALDARTVTKTARPANGYQDALPLG
ncbi:TIGR03943 family protein [Streptomyces sp. NPDC029080]|uniref:TIGR03943 family putative permease subunit n=1 Tax=Streptomyces sp. NPDC029080 TaxID=3155017 RepID=UPI00340648A8